MIGGFGLTGICTELEVHIRPVSTGWMLVDSLRCETADDVFSHLSSASADTCAFARVNPAGVGAGPRPWNRPRAQQARRGTAETRQATALGVCATPDAISLDFPETWCARPAARRSQNVTHRTAPAARRDELVPMAAFFHADAEAREASKKSLRPSPTNSRFPLDQQALIPEFLDRLIHANVMGDCATCTVRQPAPLVRSASASTADLQH